MKRLYKGNLIKFILFSLNEEYKSQIQLLTEKIKEVENQNDNLLDKLVKYTKEKSEKILSVSPLKPENDSKINEEAKDEINKKKALEIFNVGISKRGELIGNTNIRILTLKQLKEIIKEIYEHKEKTWWKMKENKTSIRNYGTVYVYLFKSKVWT